MDEIRPGLVGTAEIIVGTNDTAPRVGSGSIFVLATPVMIGLMEEAALDAVEHLLPDARQSLGTHLDVSHTAATPTGMKVTARAELVKVEGRKLFFNVTARDEVEEIGSGQHQRVVVNAQAFVDRVSKKLR